MTGCKILTNKLDIFNGMSYHQRNYTDEPLRASQKVNSNNKIKVELHVPSSSYLKSFKKANGPVVNRQNQKPKQDLNRKSFDNSSTSKSRSSHKPVQQQKNIPPTYFQQISEPQNSSHQQIQFLMQQTDNSMEELLNSSINQFQKLIIRENPNCESLEEQNYRLKNALGKMKNILKGKLESALQKQKEELSKMLEDYISLITKLLQDKEELTITLQDYQQNQQKQIKRKEEQWNMKFNELMEERDEHINSTKNQIDEFLQVIEHYEQQTKNQQSRFAELQAKIDDLQEQKDYLMKQIKTGQVQEYSEEIAMRIEAQSTKIQTLLELLDKSQEENNILKKQIAELKNKKSGQSNSQNSSEQMRELREMYEKQIQQLQQEHEEEFLEYERAIKDTLIKKDECIGRLNLIIEGLRERKCTA